MSPPSQSDVLRGSVELLVLKTLSLEPNHGWGIAQRIQQISRGHFDVNQGTLYPALQRMEARGLVTSSWQKTEAGRRARVYEITASGRRALVGHEKSWRRFADAIDLVLGAT